MEPCLKLCYCLRLLKIRDSAERARDRHLVRYFPSFGISRDFPRHGNGKEIPYEVAVDEKGFQESSCERRLKEPVHQTQEVRFDFTA